MLCIQGNLANVYHNLGQGEEALPIYRDVYSGYSRLLGEHIMTLASADNYAMSLIKLRRFEEAKSLLCKQLPVARRVLGKDHIQTIKMTWRSAEALYEDANATLEDMREVVTTLEELERTARRVLGGAHPVTKGVEVNLRDAQAVLRARETGAA